MKMKKYNFPIEGLHCASCAARAEKVLQNYPGVTSAKVNLLVAQLSIVCNETVEPQRLADVIAKAGYTLVIETANEELDRSCSNHPTAGEKRDDGTTKEGREERKQAAYKLLRSETIGATLLSLPLFVLGMFFMSTPGAGEVSALLAGVVLFYFGRGFFIRTFAQLKQRTVTMDTLVALSTSVAYLYSLANLLFPSFWYSRGITPHLYFEAAGMIVAFILIGRLLEQRAKNRTATAIQSLIGLQSQTALIEQEGVQQVVDIARVQPGDVVVVRAGEKVAVDGTVIDGESYLDESMLSGESMPLLKESGSSVYAGTLNGEGSFRFKATKVGSETLLSHIIALVEEAQSSKPPVQKLVDRIASFFVPIILVVAWVAFLAWVWLDSTNGFTHGIHAFVTVLVIACPCALGLATPTAIMVGIGAAAKRGILIKDAQSLEVAKKIEVVVLDKTGTITEGKPALSEAIWYDETPLLKEILYSLESRSTHPVAQAVVKELSKWVNQMAPQGFSPISSPLPKRNIELFSAHANGGAATPFVYTTGQKSEQGRTQRSSGSRGAIQTTGLSVVQSSGDRLGGSGATHLAASKVLQLDAIENKTGLGITARHNGTAYFVGSPALALQFGIDTTHLSFGLGSVVLFGTTDKLIATFTVTDRIKESSIEAIQQLQRRGITVQMLTGDNQQTAAYIAAEVGIKEFKAELLPSDKLAHIQALQGEGRRVAMVGDGINDSAALAQADLSIAMGSGSDVAMEVAAITLVGSDLRKVEESILISRTTIRTLRQNLFWAFVYNLIGVPVAAGALYPLLGVMLSPMLAGAAMALSSVSVVVNSLRIRGKLGRK
ncbi:MAG: heavy metal translocating P-type ATPase [Phocaeicola sp.]